MNTEKKNTKDQIAGGKTSLQEANEMEDILDLVDAASENDVESQVMEEPDGESNSGNTEEDIIDLTDVAEEPAEKTATDDAVAGEEPKKGLVSLDQKPSEEEKIIELVDEPDSEEQGVVELTDVVEEQDSQAKEEEFEELPYADLDSEEDSLLETLGLEIPDEEASTGAEEIGEEPSAIMPKQVEEEGPPSEPAAQPTDKALESMVLEKLSEEKIEPIIRRVITETVEKKADRILLEAAEAAIAKEIERLKQAL